MNTIFRNLLGSMVMAGMLGGTSATAAGSVGPQEWSNTELTADERARLLVQSMTLREQISWMRTQAGFGLGSLGVPLPDSIPAPMRKKTPAGALGSAGYIPAIERLGLPALQMTDAGLGVANLGGILRPGDESTALPSTLAMAASFDPALARRAGAMIGAEARAKGFDVLLAGGINLVREPRNGRNFEYAGEDPLLAGRIVGAQVAGIQAQGVVSTLKHYALNPQETGRFVYDARIDEAALRESDLLAFHIALDIGHPGAVMCAYNKVNGSYACENPFLLTEVLRNDWGYRGWVMSDWGAVHSLEPSLAAGLDQESPQDHSWFAGLEEAVASGTVPAERIARSARRIARSLFAAGVIDHPPAPGGTIDWPAHAQVAEQVALSGSVLLKNDGLLPLSAHVHSIAVIGGFADRGILVGGGGSSSVRPHGGSFTDTRGLQGLKQLLAPVYGTADAPLAALEAQFPDATVRFDDGSDPARAAQLAAGADAAVVFAVRPETEGRDAVDMHLPRGQDTLIAAVAAAQPRTAVVLETGNPVLMPWLDKVGAVLEAWYPGQRGGTAIARLLSGDAAPEGRLPISFPASAAELPRPQVPGRTGPGSSDNLLNSDGVKPFDLNLEEGSDVGYRWYERSRQSPLFPFGYGLTYTRFAYTGLAVHGGDGLEVSFTVRNTGQRTGTAVAQLYVAPPGRTHRLAGWQRVALEPGQSRRVTIHADPRLLASWSEDDGWHRAAGDYRLYVGRSAGDAALSGEARLSAWKAAQK